MLLQMSHARTPLLASAAAQNETHASTKHAWAPTARSGPEPRGLFRYPPESNDPPKKSRSEIPFSTPTAQGLKDVAGTSRRSASEHPKEKECTHRTQPMPQCTQTSPTQSTTMLQRMPLIPRVPLVPVAPEQAPERAAVPAPLQAPTRVPLLPNQDESIIPMVPVIQRMSLKALAP